MPYVSITGFVPRSPLAVPAFWFHALRSMSQAERANGIVFVEARRINGVQHTVSVWRSREDMNLFMGAGAHLQAMRAFPRLGHGHSFGFEADQAPPWSEVHGLWLAEGVRRATGAARTAG